MRRDLPAPAKSRRLAFAGLGIAPAMWADFRPDDTGVAAMSVRRANAAGGGFNLYVHGARGLFSVMVFAFHVANSGWTGLPVPDAGAGHFAMISFQFGVELFFGISGFVIIGALERSPSVAQFAWDRFSRIYPVLWATIAVIVGVAVATHQALPNLKSILLNVVVVPPYVMVAPINPPAWSLTWEIAFYTLCAIGFALRRFRIAIPAVVAIGLASTIVFPRTMLMLPGLLIGIGQMRVPIVRRLSRQPAFCLIGFLLAWHGLGMLAGDGPHQINPIHLPILEWLAILAGRVRSGGAGDSGSVRYRRWRRLVRPNAEYSADALAGNDQLQLLPLASDRVACRKDCAWPRRTGRGGKSVRAAGACLCRRADRTRSRVGQPEADRGTRHTMAEAVCGRSPARSDGDDGYSRCRRARSLCGPRGGRSSSNSWSVVMASSLIRVADAPLPNVDTPYAPFQSRRGVSPGVDDGAGSTSGLSRFAGLGAHPFHAVRLHRRY